MRIRAVATLAALALLTGACGDDDEDVDAAGERSSTTTETPEDDRTTTTAASGASVAVASSKLGDILVSGGRTLYVFTPDDGGPSTCYDQCAQAWPPLLGPPEAAEGVDAELLGTATRNDGGEQATVDGWPLYFFASDAAPGDIKGQGVGGNWWVVGPDGKPIMDG